MSSRKKPLKVQRQRVYVSSRLENAGKEQEVDDTGGFSSFSGARPAKENARTCSESLLLGQARGKLEQFHLQPEDSIFLPR